MEDKNKIKGWNSYPRKLWRRLVSTDIGFFFLIEFAVVVMGAIAGVLIWWLQGFKTLGDGLEFFRVLITAMIAVGGAYGLILAARRSAKFSEQVDTGQKQLFNEQFGRGAELLANGEIVMRQTGIRVLGNLAERTISEPEQVKLIMQIIHDFVRSQTKPPLEDKQVRDKGDIALGIRTLGALYNKVDKVDKVDKSDDSDGSEGFRKLLDFSWCHLEGSDFTETELQGADFWRAQLQGVRFWGAKLQGVRFMGAQLKEADFECANLQEANFNAANLQEARLVAANLQGANLISANLQGVDFWQANLQGVRFWGANLQGANFKVAQLQGAQFLDAQLQRTDFNGAQLQWADCMGVNFSDAENLTEEQVKGMIFKVDAPPKLPDDLEQFLDKRHGYEWKEDPNNESDLNYYFIDSDAKWSGKRVDDWVDKYLTSISGPEDAG